jgi:gliding motility-associated-like protein
VLCNGNSTGSVTVQATGGVPGYTYLWNTNGTSSSITNLPIGNYSVTVTDANNCTVSVSTTLTQPLAPISATLNVVDNTCFNGSIGSIDATVTGGVGPYQYTWSNSQQTEDITGLPSGNFQLLITDDNNCQLTVTAFVDQPDQITLVNSLVNNVSCFNGNNGSIDITPIGGTSPYTFLWNNNQTTEDLSGLISGAYSVSISDANNCNNQFDFTITQPTLLVGTYSFVEPLCFGYSDGQLTGIANGGVTPYSYSWSNGPITALNNQIPTGNYTLIITDNNGCQVEVNAFLDEPEQLEVSYSVSDTIGCDPLTIQLTNTSAEQFNCVWDLGNGSTLNGCDVPYTFDNPGCYDITLTVTSSLGCSNFIQYDDVVCVLPSPTAGIEANPEWLDSSDPTVEVTNTSIGAVSYVWDMGDGSELLTVNQPGLYTYPLYQLDEYTITQIVTAENGCTDTAFYTVEIDNDLLIYVPNTFTPDNDEYNQQFKPVIASQITAYHLSIYNRWGEILFESFDKNVGWDGTYNGTIVQNGTYIWTAVVSTNGTNKIVKNGHVNLIR